MSGLNGTGNGHDPDHKNEDADNVVRLPTLAERDKMRREAEKEARRTLSRQEPMINLPGLTKILLAVLVGIHLVLILVPSLNDYVFRNFSFIPAAFTGQAPFTLLSLLTPVTYMFLHGGWIHLMMNGFMLAAFGSGIERWIGPQKMLIILLVCGLCGIALHFVLLPSSPNPVVGASGALSGLFSAALIMMNQGRNDPQSKKRLLFIALIWIGISVSFGMLGGPDGSSIAWATHVGGFLGGFGVMKMLRYF